MNILGTVCVSGAIAFAFGGFAPFVGAQNSSEPLVEKETALLSGDTMAGMTNTSEGTHKSSAGFKRQFRVKKALANPPIKKDIVLRFWKLDMKKRQQQQNNSK